MPLDMPPQPPAIEYRVERSQVHSASSVVQQALAFAQEARVKAARQAPPNVHDALKALPALNEHSPAMTAADRNVLEGYDPVSKADEQRYVASRMSVVREMDSLSDLLASGAELLPKEAKAYRCRIVSMVMDPRAGAFVVGGEAAAKKSRDLVPQAALDECRPGITSQAKSVLALGELGSAKSVSKGPGVSLETLGAIVRKGAGRGA